MFISALVVGPKGLSLCLCLCLCLSLSLSHTHTHTHTHTPLIVVSKVYHHPNFRALPTTACFTLPYALQYYVCTYAHCQQNASAGLLPS